MKATATPSPIADQDVGANWRRPPAELVLGLAEVHVWLVRLDRLQPAQEQLRAVLSADEQAQAGRFRFEPDRQRYCAGRYALRTILGRYLALEPGRLAFSYTAYGRPLLAATYAGSGLRFSLSHSQGLFLLGVTRWREIGLDVEFLRRLPDAEKIAGRFFAAGERAALGRLPAADREEAFFRLWTCKEAYIKALGSGLFQPLDEFEVAFIPGQPTCRLDVAGKPAESRRWRLAAWQPLPGYVAALAVEGQEWRLRSFLFEG
ncbi:MAG: 4'-phosphopantetheinyl transferase family protein [Candidatus Promineifilaceae bacterium]